MSEAANATAEASQGDRVNTDDVQNNATEKEKCMKKVTEESEANLNLALEDSDNEAQSQGRKSQDTESEDSKAKPTNSGDEKTSQGNEEAENNAKVSPKHEDSNNAKIPEEHGVGDNTATVTLNLAVENSDDAKVPDKRGEEEDINAKLNLALEDSDDEDTPRTATSVHTQEDSSDNTPNTSPRAALKPAGSDEIIEDEKIVVKFDLGGTPVVTAEPGSPTKEPKEVVRDKSDDESLLVYCCGDPENRKKLIRTVFVLWNFLVFGWVLGQAGPTLPDLQLITGASLQEASWLFTSFNIGYLVVCAVAGFIQKKIHPDLLMIMYTSGTAITATVLPWIPNIWGMVVIRGFMGFCVGGQDTGNHAMLFATWASKAGPYLQMTHFLQASGGIISPQVTKPFTIRTSETISYLNESGLLSNYSSNGLNNQSTANLSSLAGLNQTSDHVVHVHRETKVQFAYLITGLIGLTSVLTFLGLFISSRKRKKQEEQEHGDSGVDYGLPVKIQTLVLILLCAVSTLATGFVDHFPSFLATFGMLQLNWTQDVGSSMTSLMFAMYAIGNLVGVFLLKLMRSRTLIYLSYSTTFVSLLILFVSVWWDIRGMQWFAVAIVGFTMSPLIPTLFTWTQEEVAPVSGKIASSFLFSGSIGGMVNPIILGNLMESSTPMWFIYLNAGFAVMCVILYTTSVLIVWKCGEPKERRKPFEYETQIRHNISDAFLLTNANRLYADYHCKSTLVYF